MDPTYPLVPIANFIACILVLIPLLSNGYRSWNAGVLASALWTCILCIKCAVNAIIWSNSVHNAAPIWCEFATRMDVAFNIAIPACSFIITRHLFKIASSAELSARRNGGKDIIIDLSLCVGLPLLGIALYYVVEGTRFDIVEELGCVSQEVRAGLTILLLYSSPILFPACSILFFCPKNLWFYYRQLKNASKAHSGTAPISCGWYFRLLVLGSLNILVTLALVSMNLAATLMQGHVRFWPGWATIHADWTPKIITKEDWERRIWTNFLVRCAEWLRPLFAIAFFVLFGLTRKARSRYRTILWTILKPLGLKRAENERLFTSGVAFRSDGRYSRRSTVREVDVQLESRESTSDYSLNISAAERETDSNVDVDKTDASCSLDGKATNHSDGKSPSFRPSLTMLV